MYREQFFLLRKMTMLFSYLSRDLLDKVHGVGVHELRLRLAAVPLHHDPAQHRTPLTDYLKGDNMDVL